MESNGLEIIEDMCQSPCEGCSLLKMVNAFRSKNKGEIHRVTRLLKDEFHPQGALFLIEPKQVLKTHIIRSLVSTCRFREQILPRVNTMLDEVDRLREHNAFLEAQAS